MTKKEIKTRLEEMTKAINDIAAQYNALMGRKAELEYILSEMEKLETECKAES